MGSSYGYDILSSAYHAIYDRIFGAPAPSASQPAQPQPPVAAVSTPAVSNKGAIFVGDSISYGVARETPVPEQAIPSTAIVGRRIGFTEEGLKAFQKQYPGKREPSITAQLKDVPRGSHIIVCGGTNNGHKDFTPEKLKAELDRFFKIAEEKNIKIGGWVGPIQSTTTGSYKDMRPNIPTIDKILAETMAKKGIPYISTLKNGEHDVARIGAQDEDGLHPASYGKLRHLINDSFNVQLASTQLNPKPAVAAKHGKTKLAQAKPRT